MSNVTQQTASRLKRAGMPQPEPKPYQMWYVFDNLCIVDFTRGDEIMFHCIVSRSSSVSLADYQIEHMATFAPDLDYITKLLPSGFILEMWDGRHSCKIETEETTIRTQSDSFVEAAALAYLSLHETV